MQMGRCCKCSPAPPLPGMINRTFTPAAVADYEGISTASWSSGSLTTLSGAYTSYYFHHTAANMGVAGSTYIMDPIRYSMHEPSVAGATYDSVGKWDVYSGQFSNARSYNHITTSYKNAFPFSMDSIGKIGMINTMLPVSGNSHAQFNTGASFFGPQAGGFRGSPPWACDGEWQNGKDAGGVAAIPVPELAAIAPTTQWAPPRGVSVYAFRHRVNGVAVGTLQVEGQRTPTSVLVTLAAGDTYALDVWYKPVINKSLFYNNRAGKQAIWIPVSKVTGGSKFPPTFYSVGAYAGYREPMMMAFNGINFTPNFNAATHTYELALSGGSPSWTLQNGTMTQKVATIGNGNDQWNANISQSGLSWRSPTNLPAVGQLTFTITWDREHVHLILYSSTLAEYAVFAPQNSSDYITSTSSTEWGNCSWGPRGCFNQGGATTFLPRDHPFDGYKTGTITSYNPEWPTQIIVTRKTK